MHRFLAIATFALIATISGPAAHAQPATSAAARAIIRRGAAPVLLPGTPESVFAMIQGNALNSTNGAIANGVVRLRDALFGRIVDTQPTDRSGLFEFRALDPGSYVVELMGNDQSVLAASQLLSVNAGEAATAVVSLPLRLPSFAGLLGPSMSQAAAVTSAAAASGVLATDVNVSDASPR